VRDRRLGRTGLRVSELCLGTMTFGAATPAEEARVIFDRYVERGGNFLDTAVNYAGGTSEEIVGDLVADNRDQFVIATKYSAPLRRGDPNSGGNHAKSLRQALETSLRRLRTDYIDLYWVHAWDQTTPLEELVDVLDIAVRAGKVLHIGISNTPAWAVARATTLAEAAGRARFAAIQIEYNLAERTVERELLPMSRHLGLGVLAWGPLGGGLLTGKYLPEHDHSDELGRLAADDRRLTQRNLEIAAEAAKVARELDTIAAVVSLAWLREQPARPIPILGVRTARQLDDLLGCLDLQLPEAALDRLDHASAVPKGYPHDFLARIRAAYTAGPSLFKVSEHVRH
jgi:aryl-alcohol dehydrogenase-like predicted oxidoreductase